MANTKHMNINQLNLRLKSSLPRVFSHFCPLIFISHRCYAILQLKVNYTFAQVLRLLKDMYFKLVQMHYFTKDYICFTPIFLLLYLL